MSNPPAPVTNPIPDFPTAQRRDDVFVRRVLIVFALVALTALVVFLSDLVLLVVAAVLVAVILRACADLICKVAPMPERWAVLPAALGILAVLTLTIWLFGQQMADQISVLFGMLPGAWATLKQQIQAWPMGAQLIQNLDGLGEYAGQFAGQVPLIALGLVGAIANLGLVLVGGVMLALEPRAYRDGFLLLFPRAVRGNIARALNATGHALRGWLAAQLVSMAVIGTLTGLGLWLVGTPSALGLGLFAGLAQFVPVIGPIVSAVPGLLVTSTTSFELFLLTAAVYIVVQQIEGNLVTPYVQGRIAGIPAALALFSIIAFGALFGPLGVILATPLTLIVLVLVRSLYIRDVLGEDMPLPGEKAAKTKESKT